MIDRVVCAITKFLLFLRYDIRISGIDAVAAKGTKGILFLPNHPALIDPVILNIYLRGRFAPIGLADIDQINRPVIRWFTVRWGIRAIPSIATYGSTAKSEIEKTLDKSIKDLKTGKCMLLWPAGRVYRSRQESLGANSSVERVLQQHPQVRIVLVRTKGLWGSSFGWAGGSEPKLSGVLTKGFLSLLASGVFFAPRRKVTIEFFEPPDLPRQASRNTFNRFLEEYYNFDAPANTYIPYTIWEKTGPVVLPEPVLGRLAGEQAQVPQAIRQAVFDHLKNICGVSELNEDQYLARDLGMDSLARTDIVLWLEKEFGFLQADADALQTVGDCLLASCGDFVYSAPAALKPAPARWSKTGAGPFLPEGQYLTELFLHQASRSASKAAIADKVSGIKSYRDIIINCIVLKPLIAALDGDYIGIMMPASVASDIMYFATLFAGKTPVMVNWTTGSRNVTGSLEPIGVKYILTTKTLLEKINAQGTDLSALNDRFIFIESLAATVPAVRKISAFLAGYLNWSSLRKAKISSTAVVLFTSGSETVPKAVPLTHENIITNMRDILKTIEIHRDDCLIGFLPPFHSFGLTVTTLLPVCGGARVVHHPNPVEAGMLAQMIEAYHVTLLAGTPAFIGGIIKAAEKTQLYSLRLVVTGAEKCPDGVYNAIKQACGSAVILEGYGITECSPIVSLNDENDPRPSTIGKVLPSVKYMLLDTQTDQPIKGQGTGLLLVSGPSIFAGYLNFDGPSPFTVIDGRSWYNTGDLVTIDADGILTFRGRLKRFVKLAGEMISLPAIESVLERRYTADSDKGPILAVEAAADVQKPELVLFTTIDIDRGAANSYIRQAGLSGLHSIRRVVKLPQIPLLGSGKTDYRALKKKLEEGI